MAASDSDDASDQPRDNAGDSHSALPQTVTVRTALSLHDSPTLGVSGAGLRLPPQVPDSYGKYRLLEQLAVGGMGVVFKARDTVLDRVVALKMIRAGILAQPAEVERFYLEARAAAQLRHPNIISILEIGEFAGQHYFTMGFVSGGTLALKQEQYHADSRAAVALMAKISRAVHFAHEQGILHRDLKPSNILLDETDEPLVSDFGLAKFLDSQVDMTKTGQQMGTPAYMAPEQTTAGAGKVTAAADIWALGVMLYELLTGCRPFTKTGSDLSHEICTTEPPPPSRLRSDVGEDLQTIILKCLEKEPQHRYVSAAALADDLERWLRREPIAARPLRWPERARRRFQRRPVLGLALLLIGLAGIIVAAALLLRDPERWRKNLQDDLAKGKAVTLIGQAGAPAGYRWLAGKNASQLRLHKDEPFFLQTVGAAVLELLPDPGIERYRFRADIKHESTNKGTEVGIYFAQNTQPTEKGVIHYLCRLSFNDRENLPQLFPGLKGNHAQLVMMQIGNPFPAGLATAGRVPTYYPPLGAATMAWRQLAVEVGPERARVFWEGKCIDEPDWAELNRDAERWLRDQLKSMPNLTPLKDVRPQFAPRQALGLFVHEGSASFRNVVVEPLSP
jgi:serine/threonine-protein kinase